MNTPTPELQTYYDQTDKERIFYSRTKMVFDNGDIAITVPAGFLSDGLSIPRIFRSIFSKAPSYIYAGILHDYTYRQLPNNMTRKESDKLFKCWLKAYKCGAASRRAIYWAVRIGARKNWRARKPAFADTSCDEKG